MSTRPLAPKPPDFKVEELEKLSKKELRRRANDYFAQLPDCGHEQEPAVLAKAQFYVRQLEHRWDSWVSTRDLILEVIVILLIGGEICMGFRQEKQQAKNFGDQQKVLKSTQETSEKTATLLQSSLDAQGKTNTNLQAMADSLGKQLKIIQREQDERIAAQNRRPELVIWTIERPGPNRGNSVTFRDANPYEVTSGPSAPTVPDNLKLHFHRIKESPSSVDLAFFVRNDGNTSARNVVVSARPTSGVLIRCLEFPFEAFLYSYTSTQDCPTQPLSPMIAIPARPKNRPRAGEKGVELDADVEGVIRLLVPPDYPAIQVEFILSADGIAPVRKVASVIFIDTDPHGAP